MNIQMIIGNLTRDPETGTTPSGVGYCRFTVAVRKRRAKEGEPDADFVRVTAWRGLGDSCAQYLQKGKKVAVTGTPELNLYTGQDGKARGNIELTAQEVEFLSPRAGNAPAGDAQEPAPAPAPAASYTPVDEEIPF